MDENSVSFRPSRLQNGNGCRAVELIACQELTEIKRLGKGRVFLKCLIAVAKADGIVERAEAEVFERFKAILAPDAMQP